jgi:hypothetical protein
MNEFVCSLLIGYKYEFLRPPALRCYDVFVKLTMMVDDISSQRMIEWKFYLYIVDVEQDRKTRHDDGIYLIYIYRL